MFNRKVLLTIISLKKLFNRKKKNMSFGIGDIVIYTGGRISRNSNAVGQKYRIASLRDGGDNTFTTTGYVRSSDDTRYYMQHLDGRDAGWMAGCELKAVSVTLESADEKIKQLNSLKEKINEDIASKERTIFLLKKNNLEEATNEEIKILTIFEEIEGNKSKPEKLKIIAKILKEI